MQEIKKALYLVASGQIEQPSIELEVNGEKQTFSGRDAEFFAFGMLAGLKASKDDFAAEINIPTELI